MADAGRVNIFNDDAEDSPNMTGPRAVGASLVLIYRHPNPATPLRAVVIYDGGVTKRSPETLTQRIQGVYDPAPNPDARMTHIVGDGQLLFSEQVKFGTQLAGDESVHRPHRHQLPALGQPDVQPPRRRHQGVSRFHQREHRDGDAATG